MIELVAVERLTADAAGVALIMRWGYRKYRKAHHPCGGVVETGQAAQRYLYRIFFDYNVQEQWTNAIDDCAGVCLSRPGILKLSLRFAEMLWGVPWYGVEMVKLHAGERSIVLRACGTCVVACMG